MSRLEHLESLAQGVQMTYGCGDRADPDLNPSHPLARRVLIANVPVDLEE